VEGIELGTRIPVLLLSQIKRKRSRTNRTGERRRITTNLMRWVLEIEIRPLRIAEWA
jgi:hypothetical protein